MKCWLSIKHLQSERRQVTRAGSLLQVLFSGQGAVRPLGMLKTFETLLTDRFLKMPVGHSFLQKL